MTRQRGITNGWLYLVGLVALVCAVGGAIHGVNSHDERIDAEAYKRGHDEAEAAYAKRDNEQLRSANQEIDRLHTDARIKEDRYRKDVDSLSLKLSMETKANEKLRRDDRDAIRNGSLVLRDPGRASASAAGAANCNQGAGPSPVGSAGGGDAKAGAQLSDEASEFLLEEAGRADAVVNQLAAAQSLILKQIATCNGQ